MLSLNQRAELIQQQGIFLGGPPQLFERAGRMQLMILLDEGLVPDSKVLDIGCGCLRGGYWLIHFLDSRCYFGIEPNGQMLDAGLTFMLESAERERKRPSFSDNDDFDLAGFGTMFDFVIARSVWTHASKPQITRMLEQFAATATADGVMLASVIARSWRRPALWLRDYRGDRWVGRSHESDEGGLVHHRFSWLEEEARRLGLDIVPTGGRALNFGNQQWLKVTRSSAS